MQSTTFINKKLGGHIPPRTFSTGLKAEPPLRSGLQIAVEHGSGNIAYTCFGMVISSMIRSETFLLAKRLFGRIQKISGCYAFGKKHSRFGIMVNITFLTGWFIVKILLPSLSAWDTLSMRLCACVCS